MCVEKPPERCRPSGSRPPDTPVKSGTFSPKVTGEPRAGNILRIRLGKSLKVLNKAAEWRTLGTLGGQTPPRIWSTGISYNPKKGIDGGDVLRLGVLGVLYRL